MLATQYLKIAEAGDFEDVSRLTQEFLKTTELPLTYDRNTCKQSFDAILSNPRDGTIILGIKDHRVVGLLVGAVVVALYSKDRMSTEICWYVQEEHRDSRLALKMLKAYEYWASEIAGCKIIQMSKLNTSPDSLGKIYNKLGYNEKEVSYYKWS